MLTLSLFFFFYDEEDGENYKGVFRYFKNIRIN